MPRLSPLPPFAPPLDDTATFPASPQRSPPPRLGKHEVIFLGTGCSSATPHLHCLIGTRSRGESGWPGPCAVCSMALEGDPRRNRNYRGNPSLLLRVRADDLADDGATRHVLIDCGKTFREAAQRWLPEYVAGHGGLDAVVITHEHADAVLGIDDLRSVQKIYSDRGDGRRGGGKEQEQEKKTTTALERVSMPIFLSSQCYKHVQGVFPYLMPRGGPSNKRMFVASLDWRVLDERLGLQGLGLEEEEEEEEEDDESAPPVVAFPFWPVKGFRIDAFAVEHGPGFMSLGFAFGPDERRTVYISDISRCPPATLRALRPPPALTYSTDDSVDHGAAINGSLGWTIDTLIVDCLDPGPDMYPSHFSLPQTLELVRELRPKRTLLVGMSHRFEHYAANEELSLLKAESHGQLDVQLAFDGQRIEVAAA
jgi:phosphoribosyl 1,2-cyclic phosphodiesterase